MHYFNFFYKHIYLSINDKYDTQVHATLLPKMGRLLFTKITCSSFIRMMRVIYLLFTFKYIATSST
jgi:hypothetical protein